MKKIQVLYVNCFDNTSSQLLGPIILMSTLLKAFYF